jgi:uncharacterized membrane protein YdbT with pleckstrin-like domain
MFQKIKAKAYGVGLALTVPVLAMAQSTPEAAITTAQTTILGYVALAGAAFVAVALAMVGWVVVTKFVKRMGGKA